MGNVDVTNIPDFIIRSAEEGDAGLILEFRRSLR